MSCEGECKCRKMRGDEKEGTHRPALENVGASQAFLYLGEECVTVVKM
jgi:hypothetical protein